MRKIEQMVPDSYVKNSRDFQLLCSILEVVHSAAKFNIDSIRNITDTSLCFDSQLKYLSTKLGYFTSIDISPKYLRLILEAFPYIVRNKGSRKGIEQAIYLFLKIQGVSNANIKVDIVNTGDNVPEDHCIYISIDSGIQDWKLLDSILQYVVPAGYGIKYGYYAAKGVEPVSVFQQDKLEICFSDRDNTSEDETIPNAFSMIAPSCPLSDDLLSENIEGRVGFGSLVVPKENKINGLEAMDSVIKRTSIPTKENT